MQSYKKAAAREQREPGMEAGKQRGNLHREIILGGIRRLCVRAYMSTHMWEFLVWVFVVWFSFYFALFTT